MISLFRSLLSRGRRRTSVLPIVLGVGSSFPVCATTARPDPSVGLPGHEIVEVGAIGLDLGGERIEVPLCEARPIGAGGAL